MVPAEAGMRGEKFDLIPSAVGLKQEVFGIFLGMLDLWFQGRFPGIWERFLPALPPSSLHEDLPQGCGISLE